MALGNPVSWAFYWAALRKKGRLAAADRGGEPKPEPEPQLGPQPEDEHDFRAMNGVVARCGDEPAVNATAAQAGASGVKAGTSGKPTGGSAGSGGDGNAERGSERVAKVAELIPYLAVSGVACGVVGLVGAPDEHLQNFEDTDLLWYFLFGGCSLPVAQLLFSMAPTYITSAEIACIKMTEVVLAPLLVFLCKNFDALLVDGGGGRWLLVVGWRVGGWVYGPQSGSRISLAPLP